MSHMNTCAVSDGMKKMRSRILAGIGGVSLLALLVGGCGVVVGAAVGAGAGAAVSTGTGHSPAKGALIGAGVGAAGGAIYEIAR